ncbi:MAG: TerB family tellurite resistance protein [Mariprofundaceae bacterium]
MIDRIRRLWKNAAESPSQSREHDVSLAIAALMVEVMRMDDKLAKAEHSQIMLALEQRFGLSEVEIHALIEQARHETAKANDLHRFTSQVVTGFPTEERINIISELWRVAMADGHVDAYEEQLIRRMADLVGLHHRQFIDAKIAAQRPPAS